MEKKGLILGWHQRYLLDDMHVELIRNGFKDKACSMPISALGLDIVCEFLYSIDEFFLKRIYADSDISDLAWLFAMWQFLFAGLDMSDSICQRKHKGILFHPHSRFACMRVRNAPEALNLRGRLPVNSMRLAPASSSTYLRIVCFVSMRSPPASSSVIDLVVSNSSSCMTA